MRPFIVIPLLLIAGPAALCAQAAGTHFCYDARPRPACGVSVFASLDHLGFAAGHLTPLGGAVGYFLAALAAMD